MIKGTRMMMKRGAPPPLPYDAEVEWILSDGSSYIQLPDSTSLTGKMFKDFRGTISVTFLVGKVTGNTIQSVFAMSTGRCIRVFGSTSPYSTQILLPSAGALSESVTPSNTVVEIVVVIDDDGSRYYVNDVLIDTKPRSAWTSGITEGYICPLRILADGTASVDGWVENTIYRPCIAACLHAFKYVDGDGNLVFDLQPVRVGQTGYMYDKVSGGLYGNSGSGNLVICPDKS